MFLCGPFPLVVPRECEPHVSGVGVLRLSDITPATEAADRLRTFAIPPGMIASERGAVSRDALSVTLLVAAVHATILYAWLAQPASAPRFPRPMAVDVALQADTAQAVKPKARPEPRHEETPEAVNPKPEQTDAEKVPDRSEPRATSAAPDVPPALPELADAEPDYQAAYLNNPLPAYPMVAQRMGLQGKVVLNVEVLETGKCGTVSVFRSSGHAVLDEAALETVKSWRFTPARQGGHAVTRWFKVPIVFSLRDAKHE